MAALLRVAVALNESRSQRIHDFACNVEDSRLVISIPRVDDLSLEQLTLKQNGSLFEEVFGLRVLLRHLALGARAIRRTNPTGVRVAVRYETDCAPVLES